MRPQINGGGSERNEQLQEPSAMRPTGSELPDPESSRRRKACLTIFSLNSFSLPKKGVLF